AVVDRAQLVAVRVAWLDRMEAQRRNAVVLADAIVEDEVELCLAALLDLAFARGTRRPDTLQHFVDLGLRIERQVGADRIVGGAFGNDIIGRAERLDIEPHAATFGISGRQLVAAQIGDLHTHADRTVGTAGRRRVSKDRRLHLRAGSKHGAGTPDGAVVILFATK